MHLKITILSELGLLMKISIANQLILCIKIKKLTVSDILNLKSKNIHIISYRRNNELKVSRRPKIKFSFII